MKGYGILALISFCVLTIIPLVMIVPANEAVVSMPQNVLVQHSKGEDKSEITLYDMTLYETAAKMPTDAPDEAIKAQLIADYTVLYYQHLTNGLVSATSLEYPQSYTSEYLQTAWGAQYTEQNKRFRALLDDVYGTYIAYNGQPIMAVSHIMNSGQTEDAVVLWGEDIPYLHAVSSPSDALSPNQSTTITLSITEMAAHIESLTQQTPSGKASDWFGTIKKTNAGTVVSVEVANTSVSGQQLASAVGLPSAAFDIAVQGDQVLFTAYGNGHFVGLSVIGAVGMAKDGDTYQSILKHYYTGIEIL